MSRRSCGLWLVSLMVTAGALVCGKLDWCSALAGTIAAYILYNIVGVGGRLPGAVRAVQVVWLAVPLRLAAQGAAALFPDSGGGLYVPAVVLALSWALAGRDSRAVLACCTVVGFFVLAAVAVVAVFALPQVQWRWLVPQFDAVTALRAMALGAAAFMLAEICPEKPAQPWLLAGAASPAVLAALVAGCLSPALAAGERSAFYTLSRSISVFGVVERFEALIAACLTLGILSLCTLLLHCARLTAGARSGAGISAALAVAALAACAVPVPDVVWSVGTLVLWELLPLAKKLKKSKISVDKTGNQ